METTIAGQLAQQDTARLFAAAVTRYLGDRTDFDPLKHAFLLNYLVWPPRMYIAEFDEIPQVLSIFMPVKGHEWGSQIEELCATYVAERGDDFLALVCFKSRPLPLKRPARKIGVTMRPYTLDLKFVREYSGETVPQDSESWNLRPVVEFGTEKWQCIAENDLVDDIIASCCDNDMERYWSSDVDEVAYQVYKNFGFAHIIQGFTKC